MRGQITIFEYLAEKNQKCFHSGHVCNKRELWKIADTLDEIMCPRVCCRACNVRMCGARCNGSKEPIEVKPVEIRGLCDDPYCPECNYEFWDYGDKNEVDCLKCPECGCMLDWGPWHRANDNEVET